MQAEPSNVSTIIEADQKLYSTITKEFSDQSSKKYNDDKWTLLQLDEWRSGDLPKLLASRKVPYLTKDELKLLMDWKLAKGKFRPTLPKLIDSNEADSVKEVSEAGFELFLNGIKTLNLKEKKSLDVSSYKATVKASLKELCKLRGVGPATASLMLSLLTEITEFAPPFLSDESFMFYIRDALRPLQPIKYNVKEYVDEYVPVVMNIVKNLATDVTAQALERGAWSLKTYQIYRIDRLASVKMPFTADESILDHFSQSQSILNASSTSPAGKVGKRTTSKLGDDSLLIKKPKLKKSG